MRDVPALLSGAAGKVPGVRRDADPLLRHVGADYFIHHYRGDAVMGAYCKFCDHRCFVYRQVIVGGEIIWSGHMATCPQGRAHDKAALGVDDDGAHNPASVCA